MTENILCVCVFFLTLIKSRLSRKWPRNGMRHIKPCVFQSIHINFLYSFLCTGSFPVKKGVGEFELDSSMEAANLAKLVSFSTSFYSFS